MNLFHDKNNKNYKINVYFGLGSNAFVASQRVEEEKKVLKKKIINKIKVVRYRTPFSVSCR